MGWVVGQEEIYNELDFYNGSFDDIAEMHIRLMSLFSGIYCMIFDQCKNSPHPFWHKPFSLQDRLPFQIRIAEFTLCLMKLHEDRFHRLYQGYLPLTIKPGLREALAMVSKKL